MPPSLSLDAYPMPASAPSARASSASMRPLAAALPPRISVAPAASPRRRRILAATLAFHVLLVIAALNLETLRTRVREVAPVFLSVIAAPAPARTPQALPTPPRDIPRPPMLDLPLIAPEPVPAPSPLLAQLPAAAPIAAHTTAAEAPPAPHSAETTAPAVRTIPASAVQYLVAPAPVYSRASARLKESGRAVVRVFIDEAGLPRDVQIATSTGFARLDDSAVAAVRNARFKPCLENGSPVSGWAFIPIEFELPT